MRITCVKCGAVGTPRTMKAGCGKGATNGNLGTCRNREACAERASKKEASRG